ncbi:NAD(P)-dependent oxidoreductase [Acrocarpospora macrocephala]|uniref:3-hydroxyisobutyrate dehydrogenase n=1 Tax=Acrocarpospora macrocephala TaxID=150177 RepID=A0A5M3WQ08_9ACTN|nr:NAD(P)-dependent oxidoreductase [Acrocarpospora macrocephala]GES08328.1 3-hydroxyisobutyrate dehydrogenase [Acrocarpospora macrocephala]
MMDSRAPDRVVCVVGLGNLGGAVATRLAAAGFRTYGFDIAAAARQRSADAGVQVCDRLADAVADASAVITSLPDGAAVTEAWLGRGGLVESARPGTYLIELSTIGPDTMRAVADRAAAADLKVIDAPVSGGPMDAVKGQLVVIVGGDEPDIAAVHDVLHAVGGTVHFSGPVGSAKTVKLVNNLITNATVLVSAEAFQIGVAAGLEPRRLFDLLSQMGGGKSHHFQKRFPWVLERDYDARFSIRLAEKDFRLGLELADSVGVPPPAASAMRSIYAVAMAEGLADDDIVGLVQLYERWTKPARVTEGPAAASADPAGSGAIGDGRKQR